MKFKEIKDRVTICLLFLLVCLSYPVESYKQRYGGLQKTKGHAASYHTPMSQYQSMMVNSERPMKRPPWDQRSQRAEVINIDLSPVSRNPSYIFPSRHEFKSETVRAPKSVFRGNANDYRVNKHVYPQISGNGQQIYNGQIALLASASYQKPNYQPIPYHVKNYAKYPLNVYPKNTANVVQGSIYYPNQGRPITGLPTIANHYKRPSSAPKATKTVKVPMKFQWKPVTTHIPTMIESFTTPEPQLSVFLPYKETIGVSASNAEPIVSKVPVGTVGNLVPFQATIPIRMMVPIPQNLSIIDIWSSNPPVATATIKPVMPITLPSVTDSTVQVEAFKEQNLTTETPVASEAAVSQMPVLSGVVVSETPATTIINNSTEGLRDPSISASEVNDTIVLPQEDVPSTGENVPGTAEDVPGTVEDVPGIVEDVPEDNPSTEGFLEGLLRDLFSTTESGSSAGDEGDEEVKEEEEEEEETDSKPSAESESEDETQQDEPSEVVEVTSNPEEVEALEAEPVTPEISDEPVETVEISEEPLETLEIFENSTDTEAIVSSTQIALNESDPAAADHVPTEQTATTLPTSAPEDGPALETSSDLPTEDVPPDEAPEVGESVPEDTPAEESTTKPSKKPSKKPPKEEKPEDEHEEEKKKPEKEPEEEKEEEEEKPAKEPEEAAEEEGEPPADEEEPPAEDPLTGENLAQDLEPVEETAAELPGESVNAELPEADVPNLAETTGDVVTDPDTADVPGETIEEVTPEDDPATADVPGENIEEVTPEDDPATADVPDEIVEEITPEDDPASVDVLDETIEEVTPEDAEEILRVADAENIPSDDNEVEIIEDTPNDEVIKTGSEEVILEEPEVPEVNQELIEVVESPDGRSNLTVVEDEVIRQDTLAQDNPSIPQDSEILGSVINEQISPDQDLSLAELPRIQYEEVFDGRGQIGFPGNDASVLYSPNDIDCFGESRNLSLCHTNGSRFEDIIEHQIPKDLLCIPQDYVLGTDPNSEHLPKDLPPCDASKFVGDSGIHLSIKLQQLSPDKDTAIGDDHITTIIKVATTSEEPQPERTPSLSAPIPYVNKEEEPESGSPSPAGGKPDLQSLSFVRLSQVIIDPPQDAPLSPPITSDTLPINTTEPLVKSSVLLSTGAESLQNPQLDHDLQLVVKLEVDPPSAEPSVGPLEGDTPEAELNPLPPDERKEVDKYLTIDLLREKIAAKA